MSDEATKSISTSGELALSDIMPFAEMMIKAGVFTDVKTAAQAALKIMAGSEIGLSRMESMQMLYLVGSKIGMMASLIASRIKSSKKYDYFIEKLTDEECLILFYEKVKDEKIKLGDCRFTMEEAKKIINSKTGKPIVEGDGWKNYPKNMLFARTISNGMRWFCPDVISGGVCYSTEELLDIGETKSKTVVEASAE